LVSNIFDESILNSLHGSVGVGHTRYSTAGGKEWSNVQPMFNTTANGVDIALCHNGNLVNYQELREEAVAQGLYRENEKSLSDSMVMTALLAHEVGEGKSVFDAAKRSEERRVGKECRSGGERGQKTKDRRNTRTQ